MATASSYYNSNGKEELLNENSKSETAEIREIEGIRTLVIIDNRRKREYIVDEFENLTGCAFDTKGLEEFGLWYSFDHGYRNFHIVPDEEVKFKGEKGKSISAWLEHKLGCIKDELYEVIKENIILQSIKKITKKNINKQRGQNSSAKNHKYIYLNIGKTQYLMSFNRLWCDSKDDGDHICNNFGQAQFMRYPKKGQINLINGQFELMYPASPEDEQYNYKSGHIVYNAPCSVKDDPKNIAKRFVDFIMRCENNGRKPDMPPLSIAIDKSIFNSNDGHHLLELDRETHQLVVYRRAGDKGLRDFYDLRKDFDDSPYSMFDREKVFPCIFGGWKSPTPRGFFRVENKTSEEYLSRYYPEHDQVKFFGYLEIVEDYFIHSDLYAADVTEAAMRSGEAEPLSKADTDTSGCVRVSQEALDWLVENIEERAIVIL